METLIGRITHYFGKIGVAVFEITDGEVKTGDTIHIKGHTTDLTQVIQSMQVEHNPVTTARKGEAVGLKTEQPVHEHDQVFLVTP